MSDPKSTLDKIQKEIRENLRREDELKKGYMKLENGNLNNNNDNVANNNEYSTETRRSEMESLEKVNGIHQKSNGYVQNGTVKSNTHSSVSSDIPKINGFRKFIPNSSSKGVMQKFIKSRGKLSLLTGSKSTESNDWYTGAVFDPPKMNSENGIPTRKGFVPAEEKIEKELTDFQQREAELRKYRRQSQPDLMAALNQEESEYSNWINNFKDYKTSKHTKSMANLYQVDDDARSQDSSAPSSLKPARSLAELCDISDEETGSRTQSLIMQFENMKAKEGCA